jgi:hypothetical protein
MMRERILILALSALALPPAPGMLLADIPGNPYHGIVDRNLFNLKPLPKPGDILPPPEPPPKITLTGFTTILGDKRVLFKVQVAKPPQPPKEESYILTEGQRDGDIEVLEIDEKEGVAKFNNHGTVQTLDLANNGAKPANVPPPTTAPPQRLPPTFPGQIPGAPPGAAPRTIPSRTLRIPQPPAAPGAGVLPGNPGPRPPGRAQ